MNTDLRTVAEQDGWHHRILPALSTHLGPLDGRTLADVAALGPRGARGPNLKDLREIEQSMRKRGGWWAAST